MASDVTLDSRVSPPAHEHIFRIRGVTKLNSEKSAEVFKKYDWSPAPYGWRPEVTPPDLQFSTSDWKRSQDFDKEVKPSEVTGQLFFNPQDGLVYFDVEVNE